MAWEHTASLKLAGSWITICLSAEIAQLVEHATENRGVASSILALGTLGWPNGPTRGCSSVVERLLAKEKVVGSNPIARSMIADFGLLIAESAQSAIFSKSAI